MPLVVRAFFTWLLIFVGGTASADELYQWNQSIRSLGMGGVYNSVVRGGDALFVNPAALAKMDELEFRLLGFGIGTNGYQIYQDLGSDTAFNTPADFNKVYGKDIFLGIDLKTTIALKNFAIGGYSNSYLLARFHSPPNPNFNATYFSDYGIVAGGAVDIGPESSFGLAIKRITRTGGEKDIDIGVLLDSNARNALVSSFDDKGVGYGVDAAFMTTLPTFMSPTLAVTWQDMGMTTFQKTGGANAPPRIDDNLSLGVSTVLDLPGLDWTNGFEYKYATTQGEDFGKKIHLGTEISLPFIDLRAGFSQGYTSYGVGVNLFIFSLDAAYYKTEMGAYPGQTPNERIQVGLTLSFSFDANFKITNGEGKKRRLKQRR